ncbi:hypothetical protein H2202_010944 [Exophiala xenobiotica]|nr:hypothetical protein H2202_010944 [Exophiala xenobiotica]KAK5215438.1 hypothetical protein LTR72_011499 [Exophiala xenobiotica]KAK5285156.1 hypothetical protein LTR14_011177 [Exophiala xenobiotica]KAK5312090.1 hypothetical protein LTR93_011453 [Exophiala xenobiotica]KAK5469968.1 hypothetical protein LTR55_011257 [Exophiala xenobiotica]
MACKQCRRRKVRCEMESLDAQTKRPGHRGKRPCPNGLSYSSIDESTDEPRQRHHRTATDNDEEEGEDFPMDESDDPSSADVPQPDLVHSTRNPAPDLPTDIIAEGNLPPEAPTSNVRLSRRGCPLELDNVVRDLVAGLLSCCEMARRPLQTQVDDLKKEVQQNKAEAARNRQVMEEVGQKHREEVRGLQANINRLEELAREQQEKLRVLEARLERVIVQLVQTIEGGLHDLKRTFLIQGDTMDAMMAGALQRPQTAVQAS